MNLQNGYKVIYENRAIASGALERHLRATKTLPAQADANLIYKDNAGVVITADELKAFKLVYEKDGSLFGSLDGKVNSTDRKILVYNGNDLLLGKVENAPVVQAAKQVKKQEIKIEAPVVEEKVIEEAEKAAEEPVKIEK